MGQSMRTNTGTGRPTRAAGEGGRCGAGRGFTLVEMLVVVSIIAILLAILLPVLSGARNQARVARTTTLMSSIQSAIAEFQAANRRLPGVFSQEKMGGAYNGGTCGLTQMQNAILELSGGVAAQSGSDTIAIQPTSDANDRIFVRPALIGAADGPNYLQLPADVMTSATGAVNNFDSPPLTMPQIIDAFGSPLLLWTRNALAKTTANPNPTFAAVQSPGNATSVRSLFYWSSNAGVLRSAQLGQFGRNQNDQSVIGGASADQDKVASLEALLGNPAFPAPNTTPATPAQPNGEVIVHSGGKDGLFLGRLNGAVRATYDRGASANPSWFPITAFDDLTLGGGG
ncbi:MAG: type II secretion system protein [Phycisphaerales bacterium]|nr:type II secretion system protein [Phycisphaerales bacterium]